MFSTVSLFTYPLDDVSFYVIGPRAILEPNFERELTMSCNADWVLSPGMFANMLSPLYP